MSPSRRCLRLAVGALTPGLLGVATAVAAPRPPEPKGHPSPPVAIAAARLALPADAAHRGFRLRRQVSFVAPPETTDPAADERVWGELPLPPELRSAGPSPWRDLRLVAQPLGPSEAAFEVPYVVLEEPKLLPPLRSRVPARLYFSLAVARRGPRSPAAPATLTQLTLYYGSNSARAPLYQLDLSRQPPSPQNLVTAELSDEESNPRYQAIAGTPSPLPPLPIAGPLSCYRMQHPIEGLGGADLYAVMLSPLTVGLSQSGYSDLLVIDADGRWLPAVRTDAAGESRIELAISDERPDERPDEHGGERPSQLRYRLAASFGNEMLALPYRHLELDLPDGAPAQSARLYARADRAPTAPEVLLWRGELPKEDDDRPTPVTLPVPERGRRYTELFLELHAEPGPPVAPARAVGVLPVPRLSFYSDGKPGARLLLGCSPGAPTATTVATTRTGTGTATGTATGAATAAPVPAAAQVPVAATAASRKSESQLFQALHDYGARRATLAPIEPHAAFRARQPSPSRSSATTAILWAGFVLLLGLLARLSFRGRGAESDAENDGAA